MKIAYATGMELYRCQKAIIWINNKDHWYHVAS